eukprot:CAMPEP_0197570568 /NCGR_PEP_ID=MMETSP1320-20131121/40921_1 /TAXON_ID=91990 /ORGANISM="Bolidomonas sp., Strain RCC2347" /LENGTH=194 /DNA_ID=CAMNT_0043133007 /DNA_START=20 /DNA_END=600 /DNA_ORIENTATION=+
MAPLKSQLVCAALLFVFTCMPKRWFWTFIIKNVLGWSVKGTMPDCDKAVIACYPHTHGLDLFYGLFLVFSTRQESRIMMKSSLAWMWVLGLPVEAVSRTGSGGQTGAIAKAFGSVKTRWLWIWISGTRSKSDHVSSGFYHIAKEAGVPIVFGGIDYRNKKMIPSAPIDPAKFSKDEVLEMYKDFALTHDLANSG